MAIKFLSSLKIGGITFPTQDGVVGQVLSTDGNGNLSFVNAASASGYINGLTFSSGSLTATVAGGSNISLNLDSRYALTTHSHVGVYDNYQSWNLKTNGVQRTTVQSGGTLDLVAGSNVSLSYGAGGIVTISSTDTNTDTNNYLTGVSFSTSTGIITFTRSGLSDLTVDLDGKYAEASHNHTTLTGVTSIGFAAEASDLASISTTINGSGTYFDFNLTDDNNNDWWRWRFTPSGSTVYDAMTLKPLSNGNADLTISGSVFADNLAISNWNTAYGWGNHASAGYITGYTETDTLATVTARGASTSTQLTFSGGGDNATTYSSVRFAGYNQGGGVGYHGFFEIQNTYGSVTNGKKFFRLDGSGTIQIINSAYTSNIFNLTDAGDLTVNKIIKSGGTSSQYLMADGSVSTGVSGGVTSFNTRTGAVTLLSSDVTTALGYTPYNSSNPNGYISAEANTFLGDGGSADTHPGTDRIIFTGQLSTGAPLLGMPATDNSNAILNINRHPGEYNSQLGFSSNGSMYYRSFSAAAINSTQTWRQVWDSGNFTNNSANWNTAYSWGNHAGLYAAASHTHTIANVTGLQSALDGKQAAGSYAAASHTHAATDITSGTLAAARLSGTYTITVSGNSTTATTFQTARSINGTSFNGSADITTANWGTARTITIGNTGKSVNGSGNVSWSLAEIGAQPAGSYLTSFTESDPTVPSHVKNISASTLNGLSNMLGVTTLPYSCDITVNGDANTFYAVQFWGGDQDVWRRIIIKRGYSEPAPWDPIGTGVHHGGLLLDWEGNFGGWGGAEYADRLRVFNESYTNVCADMFIYSHSMSYVFMLRGGGAVYHLFSDQAINGFYQSGSPDILLSSSTLSYDDNWSGTNQYDVYAPTPLTLSQVNASRIDGLRTKKQSLLDGRYLRQGVDISGISNITTSNNISSLNFLASNAYYLNGTSYYLNSSNGGIYTNARFESGNLIVAPGGNSSQWNTAYGWGNHAGLYALAGHTHAYLPLSGGTLTGKIFTGSTGTGTYDGAFEIRETSSVGNTQSVWGYSPAITFHWGNRHAKRFGMRSDGQFAIDDAPLALQSWVTSQGYLTSYTDTNTTYTAGTGLTLSGTTFSVTAGTYAAASHTHTIANVTGLQAALDGKQAAGTYLTSLGFSYSTGVTANHVVQRDANGYIYANHINFNTGETENPTISSFIVSNGDGWSRKASVAHVKGQLGLGSAAYVATSTFAAASHTHSIANVTGLQAALDGKQAAGSYLTTSGKAADSELIDGIDSSRIVYGDGVRKSTRQGDMNSYNQYSGFFYESSPSGGPFGDWTNWINVMGNDWADNYGFQLAHAFHSDKFAIRRVTNGSFAGWRTIIDSDTIGSQSVSYAATAGTANNISAYTINQSVGTSNTPTFADVYVNGWFRNNVNNQGLYNQANGTHFYSNAREGYVVTGSGGTVQLQFKSNHETTLRGYVYGDTSSNFGLLNDQGGWSVRCYAGREYGGALTGTWTASGDLVAYSDARVKENVETIDNALNKVLSLRGVTYNRTDTDDKSKKMGVIAQEVQKIIPEVVQEQEDGMLGVSYGNMVGVLIEAVKEQQAMIETLEAKLEILIKYLK